MSITLKQARIIAEASIAKGRELDLKPLSVVILDPRTSLVAKCAGGLHKAKQMPPSSWVWVAER